MIKKYLFLIYLTFILYAYILIHHFYYTITALFIVYEYRTQK